MPVSLERLVAEREPGVITEDLLRECARAYGGDDDDGDGSNGACGDGDLAEEKRRQLPFAEIGALELGFQRLARVSGLGGLRALTKLCLDNNRLEKIEGIDHLVNLTWLDLSFNQISVIEGLGTLTRLRDLSLHSNKIVEIGGLDGLTELNVLSIGDNAIASLHSVGYLRRFPKLQLLNLAGNPIAARDAPACRAYALAHLPALEYYDYARVDAADAAAARELHQDSLLELAEREDAAARAAAAAAEAAARAAALRAANLTGVETLADDVAAADPEWARLSAIPGLTEPWGDIKEKWRAAAAELEAAALAARARRDAEEAEFEAALAGALAERDAEARGRIAEYEAARKAAARACAARADDAEERVLSAKVKLMALRDALLGLELDAADAAAQLSQEYERAVTEMAESSRQAYAAFFAQVRALEAALAASLAVAAPALLERYGGSGNGGGDAQAPDAGLLLLPPDAGAAALLANRDALGGALQASRDARAARVDALEDALLGAELRRGAEAADANARREAQRHRSRMGEILGYLERGIKELDAMGAGPARRGAGAGRAE